MSGAHGMSTRLVARALRLLDARELATDAVLAECALDRATLLGDGRIDYASVDRLIEACARHVGPAELGLALARVEDEAAYGAAGLLLLTSPTLRQGLARAFAYQRLWGDGQRFTQTNSADGCRIAFRHPGSSELARAVLAECALAEVLAGARALVAADAVPLAVEFAHAPLGPTAELAAYFGVEPRFSASESALVFGASVADRPLRLLREQLARGLEEHCRRTLAALPAGSALFARVEQTVRDTLELGLTLPALARRLKMSTRTLQRVLAREGTTFHALHDRERRARAEQLLALGASLKEAAARVGYAEPRALARARRRWGARG